MRNKNSSGVEETVLEIVSSIGSRESVVSITSESRLKCDLGFDSLNMLELCVSIEGALKIRIADNLGNIETVRDIVTLIENGSTSSRVARYNIEDYPLPRKKRHICQLKLIMFLSRLAWRFDISGLEYVPADGRYILCPNHQSHFDGLWIWTAISHKRVDLSKISCLAKHEHLDSWLSRFMLSMLGGIPVDRDGNSVPAMKRALTCIQNGYTMLIHPEGTRTQDGKIHEFKGGASKLAIDAGVPVIPVRIEGALHIFPAHRKFPKIFRFGSRYPVRISFGKPIAPDGKSVEKLIAQIQSTVGRLEK